MKSLKVRFCRRNLEEEGSAEVKSLIEKRWPELTSCEVMTCLSQCTLCTEGPYCAVEDLIFQELDADQLSLRMTRILDELDKAFQARRGKATVTEES